jgi:Tfp pilus assembly ATPase PilU
MDRSTAESKVSGCLITLLEVGLESAQYALALKVGLGQG